jgi:hypothetical protein
VSGKTVTETFPNPTRLLKAQQEVAEFHRFQKLSQDLVALNDKSCRHRPVEQQRGGWSDQEKKRLLRSAATRLRLSIRIERNGSRGFEDA